MQTNWPILLRDAALSALIALLLFGHLVGLRTVEQNVGLGIQLHWIGVAILVAAVFGGRVLLGMLHTARSRRPAAPVKPANPKFYTHVMLGLLALAVLLPFTPFSSRYVLDVLTLIFTYMVLASGLNLVVGMTGLLDLGFAAFYAIGAYAFSFLALKGGMTFWEALPYSILLSALIAGVIGLIVLRLRGDYLAIVTLGFAEIMRILLLNWASFTGGPNGITGIPRPTFFGFVIDDPALRVMFLYYLAIFFFVIVALVMARLRRMPLGRAFEAVREDELAAQAAGINLTRTKLSAYMLASCCGALAGAFFASRQGFISPESFTFTESALVLAIVVLAGMGHPLGLMLAAGFLVGLPELFRELQDYRLIAFGAGMVLIMLWRPQGLFSQRPPVITLETK